MYDIDTQPRWLLKCKDCDFESTCYSAGGAEEEAGEHLNKEDHHDKRGYEYPNYSHLVTITQVTIVGRNL